MNGGRKLWMDQGRPTTKEVPSYPRTNYTVKGGDPSKINPTLNACVLVYAPVTAEVTGTWRGTPVAWKQRYGNTCEMRRATGALFQF